MDGYHQMIFNHESNLLMHIYDVSTFVVIYENMKILLLILTLLYTQTQCKVNLAFQRIKEQFSGKFDYITFTSIDSD